MSRRLIVATLLCLLLATLPILGWLSSGSKQSAEGEESTAQLPAENQSEVLTMPGKLPGQDASKSRSSTNSDELTDADYRRALDAFMRLYPGNTPTREDLFSVAGEMAVADRRFQDAVRYFAAIPTEHPMYGLPARLQQGLALLELNQALAAESQLKAYLSSARLANQVRAEDVIYAFKWLNYILSVTLRLEERKKHLEELHQLGLADLLDSKQYLFPNLLILNSPSGRKRAEQFASAEPSNELARVAVARYLTMNGEYDAALQVLQSVDTGDNSRQSPVASLVDAAKLEAFFDAGMIEEFDAAIAKLPPSVVAEPWLVTRYRGEYALQHKEFEEAIGYFSDVLTADPANAPAQMGLVESQKALDRAAEHAEALQDSSTLAKIRSHLPAVQSDNLDSIKTLISYCESIDYQQATKIFEAHVRTIEQLQDAKNPPVPAGN